MPRVIHGIDGIVLLVSRIYVCKSGHRCISHDERILITFPSSVHLPFVLTHRSGLTTECLSLVTSFIEEGKKISVIQAALLETRRRLFYRNCLSLAQLFKNLEKTFSLKSKFEDSINGLLFPGKKILLSAFLQNFWKYEACYRRRMYEIGVHTDWICCDHTFKSVANIGIYQSGDGGQRWVKQFKSLFIVLNDNGQVLSWQFAEDTSIDSVHGLLTEIKTRLENKKEKLKEIYVDDCCKVRHKLQDIFGQDVAIKLDLFHTVQRITKKVSKRHPLFYHFAASLKNIFRNPDDIGEVRSQSTPEPQILEINIKAFVDRWNGITSTNGQLILTTRVCQEINKLRTHVAKGCLSYIKPGRGTNRDESLHKRINSFMKYSKVGVELAYALLMSGFDRYNEDLKKPIERRSVIEYEMECILSANNVEPIKLPKFGLLTLPQNKCSELEENDHDELEDDIDDNDILEILQKVKALTQIIEKVEEKRINKAIFNEQFIPFMNSAASALHSPNFINSKGDLARHTERLQAVVRGWGFGILRTEGDGNCFFSSAAISILQILDGQTCSHGIVEMLESYGIHSGMSVAQVASRLREILVTDNTGILIRVLTLRRKI